MTRYDALRTVAAQLRFLTAADIAAALQRLRNGRPLAVELATLTHLNLCRARCRTLATLSTED